MIKNIFDEIENIKTACNDITNIVMVVSEEFYKILKKEYWADIDTDIPPDKIEGIPIVISEFVNFDYKFLPKSLFDCEIKPVNPNVSFGSFGSAFVDKEGNIIGDIPFRPNLFRDQEE
jgi:hypothetical protein